MWKDVVILYFKVLTRSLPEGTGETRNTCQDSRCVDRESKPEPLEYEAGVITTQIRHE
jgi:hypothetical protein